MPRRQDVSRDRRPGGAVIAADRGHLALVRTVVKQERDVRARELHLKFGRDRRGGDDAIELVRQDMVDDLGDLVVVLDQEQHDAYAERREGARQRQQDVGIVAVGLREQDQPDDIRTPRRHRPRHDVGTIADLLRGA